MGFALLLIGRYAESIVWHQRALAVYPDAPRRLHADRYRMIAAANALSGQIDEARRAMSESNRLWAISRRSSRTYADNRSGHNNDPDFAARDATDRREADHN